MKNGRASLDSLALALLLPAAGWAQSGPSPIKFGGQFRLRYEATGVESYAAKRRQADATSLRTRLSAEAAPAEGVGAFLQIQDSRTSGSETSTTSNDKNVDMHQAYLDLTKLMGRNLDLRAGRQELAYGDQRLVGPSDWSNVGRSFDGARLRYGASSWKADLFLTRVKDVGEIKQDQVFSGLYAACSAVKDHEFDAYLLSREYGDNSQVSEVSGGAGNLSERTLGARGKGRIGLLDYSAEAAHQFGRKATDKINAHALALSGGVNPSWAYKPRFGVGYDFASGDSDPTDGTAGAFDPLFPSVHLYQGYADVVGWRNIHDMIATASAEPIEGTRVQLDFHGLRLAQAKDSWVDKTGATVTRDAAGNSGRDLGSEVDIHVKTSFRKALKLWLGYSRFFKGSYVSNTIGGRSKDWAFVQAILNF